MNDDVFVSHVLSPSPAQAAGIIPGDIIVSINGTSVKNPSVEEAKKLFAPMKKLNEVVRLEIKRAGKSEIQKIEIKTVKLL